MSNPLISVIMSVYKEPVEWMQQSIDSVLNQTFNEFEFIIVNDCPDRQENKDILSEYERKDKRVFIITNEHNIGLTKSLNKALARSNGAFVARMDADDVSMPERFNVQIDYMNNHPEVWAAGSQANAIDENGLITSQVAMPLSKKDILYGGLFSSPIIHPTVMMRKTDDLVYDETLRYGQDYGLWLSMMGKGKMIVNLPDRLINYRYSSKQIHAKHREEQDNCSNYSNEKYLEALNFTIDAQYVELWHKLRNGTKGSYRDDDVEKFLHAFYDKNHSINSDGCNYIYNRLLLNYILTTDFGKVARINKYISLSLNAKTFNAKYFLHLLYR